MSRFEEGAMLAGRYEVRDRLGIGGFAEVYGAWDTTLDRRVAVKLMLTAELTDDEEDRADLVERFRREATLAARVEHPNVVQIYDVGELDETGEPYIVMEYLNGYDLDVQLRKHGPLAPERALRLFKDALLALALAHESGIVHKDLKPSNLFLTRPGTAYERLNILDFGVAHLEHAVQGRLTREGQVVGTPSYLSPEYATERIVKPALDVYQMGLIFIEALTCRVVVEHFDPVSTMFAHVRGDLDIPDDIRNSPLGPLLQTALALDHNERFQDAMAFYSALAPFTADGIPDLSDSDVRKHLAPSSGPIVQDQGTDGSDSPQTGRHAVNSTSDEQGTLLMYHDGSDEYDAQAQPEESPRDTRVGVKTRTESDPDPQEEVDVEPAASKEEPARTVVNHGHTRALTTETSNAELEFQTSGKRTWIAVLVIVLLGGGSAFVFLQKESVEERSSQPTEGKSSTDSPANAKDSNQVEVPAPAAETGEVEPQEEAQGIVTLMLESEPEKVSVFEGERLVGVTPLEIDFFSSKDSARNFRFEREGYRPSSRSIAPDDSPEVRVTLEKLKEPEPVKPPQKPERVESAVEKKPAEDRAKPARKPSATPKKKTPPKKPDAILLP